MSRNERKKIKTNKLKLQKLKAKILFIRLLATWIRVAPANKLAFFLDPWKTIAKINRG